VQAEVRAAVGLRPEELAAPVGRGELVAHQRGGDLAGRVRTADVAVVVIDGDDLAAERALDLLAGAFGLWKFRHLSEATIRG
jgi:hypothetical protein